MSLGVASPVRDLESMWKWGFRFVPRLLCIPEKDPPSSIVGSWVDPWAHLHGLEKRKFYFFLLELKYDTSIIQSLDEALYQTQHCSSAGAWNKVIIIFRFSLVSPHLYATKATENTSQFDYMIWNFCLEMVTWESQTAFIFSAAILDFMQWQFEVIGIYEDPNLQTSICRRYTRVGTLIVATIYLQLIHNRYMFRSFTVLQCSHQHCVQPVASDVEVVGYL